MGYTTSYTDTTPPSFLLLYHTSYTYINFPSLSRLPLKLRTFSSFRKVLSLYKLQDTMHLPLNTGHTCTVHTCLTQPHPQTLNACNHTKEQVWERKQTHTFPSWGSKTKGSHGVLITTWKTLSSSICTLEYMDIQLIGKDSRPHLNPEGVTWKWKVPTSINWYKQNTLWDVHTSHYNSSTLLYTV